MRETTVEEHLKEQAFLAGGKSYKWVSPGLRGVPDQIVLAWVPPKDRPIVAKYLRFVETKAPGEPARGQQELRHTELRLLGFEVAVIDNTFDAGKLIKEMG